MGEPYFYTLTFGSATEILTKRIRIRIQRRRPNETGSGSTEATQPYSTCVCRLTAVVYEYTLRLSSRHFFTAVKLFRKVRRQLLAEPLYCSCNLKLSASLRTHHSMLAHRQALAGASDCKARGRDRVTEKLCAPCSMSAKGASFVILSFLWQKVKLGRGLPPAELLKQPGP